MGRGACSTGPEVEASTPGPVFVGVLHGRTFAKPLAVSAGTAQAVYANAVAVGTGATVSWAIPGATGLSAVFSVEIGASGLSGETQQSVSGVTALTADGGGDVVFAPYRGPGSAVTPASAVFVRPAGGGLDQPAPAVWGDVVTAPFGRSVAMTWYTGRPTLELSVWLP